MCEVLEVEYLDVPEDKKLEEIIEKVLLKCYEVEHLDSNYLYVNVILTNPENIQKLNKQYRNIDKATDVLSFPMFEKEELVNFKSNVKEVLGDIVISLAKVEEQAKEYGHSFEREFAYMVVHGFYHIIGYDHIKEEDKKEMRAKEEIILKALNIER
ncbi:MAG: rRNA maturation RNase YbeY [Clostridia bacterium]|nr:rRNA maturation RNase YbeY [Clostridia bacterium]